MFPGNLKYCFWAVCYAFAVNHGMAQYGPGGVADKNDIVLWLSASELSNITIANPSWKDSSIYGNDAYSLAAQIPQIEINAYGIHPGALFQGIQTMTVGDATELDVNDQFSIAAVFTRTGSDTDQSRFVFTKGAENGTSNGFSISERAARVIVRVSDGVSEYYDSVSYGGINQPAFAIVNYQKLSNKLTINTGANSPAEFNHITTLGSLQNAQDLIIAGSSGGLASDNWTGYLGEIVVFDRDLNQAEIIILENYLGANYSIPVSNQYYAHVNNYGHQLAGLGRVDIANQQIDAKGSGVVRIGQPGDMDDGEFMLWGHDNGKENSGGTQENIYRVDITGGDPGQVSLRMYLSGYGISDLSQVALLVSDNKNFINAVSYQPSSWDNVEETVGYSGVVFEDDQYFTILANSLTGIPPFLTGCPSDITQNNEDGECGAQVIWIPPISNGILSSSHNPGDYFPVGTTTVSYTAVNIDGTATCSFTVTVIDNESPELGDCPDDIELDANENCEQQAFWTPPTATDNCSVTLSSTHNPGDFFPLGTTRVTYTATDNSGKNETCDFEVTVVDNASPVIENCSPALTITDYQSGTNDAQVSWTPPTAFDNCFLKSFESSHNPGDRFPEGTTMVSYTAEDEEGNSQTCEFEVTVSADNSAPVVQPLSITVNAGTTINICFEASDPDGNGLQLTEVTNDPLISSIGYVDQSGLCFEYTAVEGFEGSETISTQICDDAETPYCTKGLVEINVEVLWELEISQVITPNGDGINDTWYIGNIDKFPNNRVVIFDRWGTVIYRVNQYNNSSICWDGHRETDQSSRRGIPSGTYYYRVDLDDGRNYKGFIELVEH